MLETKTSESCDLFDVGPTHSIVINGGFNAVTATVQQLHDKRVPLNNYTVVPSLESGNWAMTYHLDRISTDPRLGIPDAKAVLETNPRVASLRDISHVARRHSRLVLNKDHDEAAFLHAVILAAKGRVESVNGKSTHRISMAAQGAARLDEYVSATPGVATQMRINPTFEDLGTISSEHPVFSARADTLDRPDFAPNASRFIISVNGGKELLPDIHALQVMVQKNMSVESVTYRTMASDESIVDIVIVVNDTTQKEVNKAAADISYNTAMAAQSKIPTDNAFQFIQKSTRAFSADPRDTAQQLGMPGFYDRDTTVRSVKGGTIRLHDAPGVKRSLAEAGIPFMHNGVLLPSNGDKLRKERGFGIAAPDETPRFRQAIQRDLLKGLGLID